MPNWTDILTNVIFLLVSITVGALQFALNSKWKSLSDLIDKEETNRKEQDIIICQKIRDNRLEIESIRSCCSENESSISKVSERIEYQMRYCDRKHS